MKRTPLRSGWLLLALGLFILGGCDSKKKDEQPGKSDPAAATSAKPTTAPPPDKRAPAAPPSRTPKEVRDFVASWLKAQNEGNFEAYSRLYASRFTGVKRAGGRTFHFDRAGWMGDRKKMFRKPMAVFAEDIEVRTAGTTSNVEFVQSWSSGAYSDEGPKRLLLVEEKGDLVIAIEEMLASEVQGSTSDLGPGGFYFMLRGGIELDNVAIPVQLGPPTLVTGAVPRTVVMSVNDGDLAPSVIALKGKKFSVDGDCTAEVTGFEVVSRAELHFGQENRLNCTFQDDACTPATSEEIADIVSGIGHQVLVAQLDNCTAGTVARPASEPKFIQGTPVTDADLEQQALAAFARLEAVKKQVHPEGSESVPPDWWKGKEEVHIYEHPISHRTIVAVDAAYGEHCGAPLADCLQTWEVTESGLTPLQGCFSADKPMGAFDVNGDGLLELLVEPRVVFGEERSLLDLKSGGTLLRQFYHYGDCPC